MSDLRSQNSTEDSRCVLKGPSPILGCAVFAVTCVAGGVATRVLTNEYAIAAIWLGGFAAAAGLIFAPCVAREEQNIQAINPEEGSTCWGKKIDGSQGERQQLGRS